MKFTALIAAASALALAASAHANSFTNGDFSSNGGNGQVGYNTTITSWYVPSGGYTFLYADGTADTGVTVGQYGNNDLWGLNNGGLDAITSPPDGAGQFIAQDGDFQVQPLDQDITGLTVGKTYTVGFDYAYAQQSGFNGDTIQYWAVSRAGHPRVDEPQPRLHRLVQRQLQLRGQQLIRNPLVPGQREPSRAALRPAGGCHLHARYGSRAGRLGDDDPRPRRSGGHGPSPPGGRRGLKTGAMNCVGRGSDRPAPSMRGAVRRIPCQASRLRQESA